MKKTSIFMVALLAMLSICGCTKSNSKGNDEVEARVSVETAEFDVEADGGSFDVVLTATLDWAATCDNWITLAKTSGAGYSGMQFITVTVAKNETTSARTGKITFSLPGKNLSVDVNIRQAGAIPVTTIAEFCKAKVDTETWYTLRGTITSIEGYSYGNFYLKDDTGEILIYGMSSKLSSTNDQSFASLGLKPGDILTLKTLRSEYQGEAQGGGSKIPAYYVSHVEGSTPAALYKDFTAKKASSAWMELPSTSDSDSYQYIYHGMNYGSTPFRNYSCYFDPSAHVALWVAYPLTRKSISYGSRSDAWTYDPLIDEADQANISMSSYKAGNAGSFIRGHMVPSADRLGYQSNLKTFYSTNIYPQNSDLNSGIWETLEESVRTWAKNTSTDTLYVTTGNVLKGSENYVYDNNSKKITVPTGIFKAVLRLSGGKYTACAFYFDNTASTATKLKDCAISIDALEEKTGLDLFTNLAGKVGDSEAASIEAADPKDNSYWWN